MIQSYLQILINQGIIISQRGNITSLFMIESMLAIHNWSSETPGLHTLRNLKQQTKTESSSCALGSLVVSYERVERKSSSLAASLGCATHTL